MLSLLLFFYFLSLSFHIFKRNHKFLSLLEPLKVKDRNSISDKDTLGSQPSTFENNWLKICRDGSTFKVTCCFYRGLHSVPSIIRQLTTISKYSSRSHSALYWPLWPPRQMLHIHIGRKYTQNKSK